MGAPVFTPRSSILTCTVSSGRTACRPGSGSGRSSRGTSLLTQDVRYERYQLIVELDGRAAHPGQERWRDIHRDNASAADGCVTLRYSWSDVTLRTCEVAAEVGRVLRSRAWIGQLRPCGPDCTVRD
jgi:hypothetical protein